MKYFSGRRAVCTSSVRDFVTPSPRWRCSSLAACAGKGCSCVQSIKGGFPVAKRVENAIQIRATQSMFQYISAERRDADPGPHRRQHLQRAADLHRQQGLLRDAEPGVHAAVRFPDPAADADGAEPLAPRHQRQRQDVDPVPRRRVDHRHLQRRHRLERGADERDRRTSASPSTRPPTPRRCRRPTPGDQHPRRRRHALGRHRLRASPTRSSRASSSARCSRRSRRRSRPSSASRRARSARRSTTATASPPPAPRASASSPTARPASPRSASRATWTSAARWRRSRRACKAYMDVEAVAGGYAAADTGLSLGLLGGGQGDPHNSCVPVVPPPTVPAIPQSKTFYTDVLPDKATPYHLGIGVHRSELDTLGWSAFDAGALCLHVGTPTVALLSSKTIALIIPSLQDVVHVSDAPMFIALKPSQPPTFTLGKGTFTTDAQGRNVVDDPLLHVHVPGARHRLLRVGRRSLRAHHDAHRRRRAAAVARGRRRGQPDAGVRRSDQGVHQRRGHQLGPARRVARRSWRRRSPCCSASPSGS